jgi:hypothetical protein
VSGEGTNCHHGENVIDATKRMREALNEAIRVAYVDVS